VLYLLTIDSDATLVSSTFEITHSSNFESRWLLPVWPFGDLRILLLHALPAPNDFVHHKYGTQTTQKRYPRGVQFYLGYGSYYS